MFQSWTKMRRPSFLGLLNLFKQTSNQFLPEGQYSGREKNQKKNTTSGFANNDDKIEQAASAQRAE